MLSEILSSERKWCKDTLYRDGENFPIGFSDFLDQIYGDYINPETWEEEEISCCLQGAAYATIHLTKKYKSINDITILMTKAIQLYYPEKYQKIVDIANQQYNHTPFKKLLTAEIITSFNDDPDTTFDDIKKVVNYVDENLKGETDGKTI